METILERIKKGRFWQFHGGIHPPEQKFLTTGKPIKKSAIPTELIIPIQQHIGVPGEILVNVGDKVLKGQPLTQPTMPMMVPVHAPTSGTVTNIAEHVVAHPSGLKELCVFIESDGLDTWREKHICPDYQSLSKHEIINKIANAGISGMGGAGFPTHIKVDTKANIEYLIINAVECEPYITADDLLIREHSVKVLEGINILKHLLSPDKILIGIEDNKPEAIDILTKITDAIDDIHVCVIPTKYPSGGEKQLIKILTGQEVPSGNLPSSLGIVMQNVATCFAIAEAVIDDVPLIKRVVTVTGQALTKPQNIWAFIGTPVYQLLNQFGFKPSAQKQRLIMGGPMMGFTLNDDRVPVIKSTNCLLAPTSKEITAEQKEVECIRCGQCAEVCPSQLLPQELQWSAKAKDHDQLHKLNLFDCIDCGACAFVCPSHIPLVHYYRIAKAEIRQKQLADIKAEKAKIRFEARKARLERDKKEREEKQRKASEARRAAMNSKSAEGESAKSAVAAALARVKAKKAQQQEPEEQQDKKSQVAAAIARAKAKKQGKQTESQEAVVTAEPSNAQSNNAESADDKKARIAAAVARAKAKKLGKPQEQASEATTEVSDKPAPAKANTEAADDKKARIAAAVAKAKAKKQGKPQADASEAVIETADEPAVVAAPAKTNTETADDKKARIAAAVAKAKAKKQGKSQADASEMDVGTSDEPIVSEAPAKANTEAADDKKARIAAAVAKAKAKKQGKSQEASEEVIESSDEPTVSEAPAKANAEAADDKKARIAAAVAKAKAKKQGKSQEVSENLQQELVLEVAPDIANENSASVDDKKARIAAAVAKAKAKRAQQSTAQSTDDITSEEQQDEQQKKARIAAAVAKAKAKKQLRNESQ